MPLKKSDNNLTDNYDVKKRHARQLPINAPSQVTQFWPHHTPPNQRARRPDGRAQTTPCGLSELSLATSHFFFYTCERGDGEIVSVINMNRGLWSLVFGLCVESLVFGGCAFPPVSLGPAGDCPRVIFKDTWSSPSALSVRQKSALHVIVLTNKSNARHLG